VSTRECGEARRAYRYPHAALPEADLCFLVPQLLRHAVHEVLRCAIRPQRLDGGGAERAVDGHQRAEGTPAWILLGREVGRRPECGADAFKHLG
jgi:hypothetical protein